MLVFLAEDDKEKSYVELFPTLVSLATQNFSRYRVINFLVVNCCLIRQNDTKQWDMTAYSADLVRAVDLYHKMEKRRAEEYDYDMLSRMMHDCSNFRRIPLHAVLFRMLQLNEDLPPQAFEILIEMGDYWLVNRLFVGKARRIREEMYKMPITKTRKKKGEAKLRRNDREYKQAIDRARMYEKY